MESWYSAAPQLVVVGTSLMVWETGEVWDTGTVEADPYGVIYRQATTSSVRHISFHVIYAIHTLHTRDAINLPLTCYT